MPVSLVVGASGAIGRFLLPRLLDAGHTVIALSRTPRVSFHPGLRWIAGDLYTTVPALPALDAVFSLGPLDAFARWLARSELAGRPRVLAIGSMSVETKRDSVAATERALASRLQAAERELASAAAARGCAWTLFRPTLIYGAGVDRSLSPIARFAERWRVFPRIIGARGLRQPVHAEDLAAGCLAASARSGCADRIYALGGGERLGFEVMLERVRASLPVRTLPAPVPFAVAHALARGARAFGSSDARVAAIERLRRDLVAEHAAAVADFDWAPRGFAPDARMWHSR